MAQGDHDLLRGIVRSISKRLDWDASPASDGAVRLTVRQPDGEAKMAISREELDAYSVQSHQRAEQSETVHQAESEHRFRLRHEQVLPGGLGSEPTRSDGKLHDVRLGGVRL